MHSKNIKEEEFVNNQKKRIELSLTGNYRGIKSFSYTKTEKIPTGVIIVHGYVNGDPDLNFSAFLTPYEDYEAGGTESSSFADTFHANKLKKVSELLKEQKEKQSH